MAVPVPDAVSSTAATGDDSTDVIFAHTCTGLDLWLVLHVQYWGAGTVDGATYNGVPMSLLTSFGGNHKVYYLIGPATGTHNIVIGVTGDLGDPNEVVAAAASYTTVDQVTPYDGLQTGTGTTAPSVAVASSAGNLVVGGVGAASDTPFVVSVGADQAPRVNKTGTDHDQTCAISDEAGGASVTHSYSLNVAPDYGSSIWAVNLRASGTAATAYSKKKDRVPVPRIPGARTPLIVRPYRSTVNATPSNASVAVDTAVASWGALAPTATPGALTAAASLATAAWSAPAPTGVPGALSAAPTIAIAAWSGLAPTVAPGGLSASPTQAVGAWSGLAPTAVLGNTISVGSADAAWSALAPAASMGGVSAAVTIGVAAWLALAPSTSLGGFSSSPGIATGTWTAVDLVPLWIPQRSSFTQVRRPTPLVPSEAGRNGPLLVREFRSTVNPSTGQQSVAVGSAVASWSALAPSTSFGGVTAGVSVAAATWAAVAPAAAPGGLSAAPVVAVASWSAPTPAIAIGALATAASVAVASWSALSPVSGSGGVGVVVQPSVGSWSGVSPSAQLGTVQVAISPALGSWVALAPTISGAAFQPVAPAAGAWSGQAVTLAIGTLSVQAAPAVGAWVAVEVTIVGGLVVFKVMEFDAVIHRTIGLEATVRREISSDQDLF